MLTLDEALLGFNEASIDFLHANGKVSGFISGVHPAVGEGKKSHPPMECWSS